MADTLKHRTMIAFLWSMAQSWLVRLFSLAVFVVVARLLTPGELGLAQAVTLMLAFVTMIGEFGFHTALVQAPDLEDADVNLPFYVSTAIGVLGSVAMLCFAKPIAQWLGVPGAESLLRLAALVPPLTASTGVVVALFRRELDFSSSAYANLSASLLAGLVAVSLAWAGAGAVALVVQAICAGLVTAAIVWRRSHWRPSRVLRFAHFKRLLSFSSFSYASAMVEYFAARVLDIIILSRYGLMVLGVFTVGAKLYGVLLELMAAALTDVAASMLAKIRGHQERVQRAYVRLLFIGACTASAVLVMTAAVAPEVIEVLFGPKWHGAALVTQVLCVLGGLQVLQLFNTALLLAHGKSNLVFAVNAARLMAAAIVLGLAPAANVVDLSLAFAASQAVISPLSFGAAARVAGVRVGALVDALWPAAVSLSLAFVLVEITRSSASHLPLLMRLVISGAMFVAVHAAVMLMLRRQRLLAEWRDLRSTRSRPGQDSVPAPAVPTVTLPSVSTSGSESETASASTPAPASAPAEVASAQRASTRAALTQAASTQAVLTPPEPAGAQTYWLVTDQLPFPPRNGVTLPSYHHALALREKGPFRLALLVDQAAPPGASELAQNEAIFGPIVQLLLTRRSRAARIANELLRTEMYQHGFVPALPRQDLPVRVADLLLVTPFSAVAKLRAVAPDVFSRCAGAYALVNDCTAGEYFYRLQERSGNWRERCKARLDRLRSAGIGRIEREVLSRYRRVLLQTRRDDEIFARLVGGEPAKRTALLPNGVREELFAWTPDEAAPRRSVVFMAELSGEYGAIARWLVQDVWPRVQLPGLELLIVGRGAGETLVQAMACHANVRHETFVPRLEAVYEHAAMAISPVFKGFGLINKTLEAMAAGVPVIGGRAAFNGIEGFVAGVHGQTCARADAGEFAQAITCLAQDPQRMRAMGQAGRSLVARGFRWQDASARLIALMTEAPKGEECVS